MVDNPWHGDAVSLGDEFRAGRRLPGEELAASLEAIQRSSLNAVCFTDPSSSQAAAEDADPEQPFGGVAVGVKELDRVEGWPDTHGSVALADGIAGYTDTKLQRIIDAGGVLAAQTTSSEFGGVNQTFTKLHGATRNPWDQSRTPGGSSGGSAAAVAGGLLPIATGGDGGGSIRIPAGFCGLVGLKCTWGRIPRGPHVGPGNLTAVPGCLSRSVRDTARWFDVTNGFDAHDPLSLPRVDGWEQGLGSFTDAFGSMTATIAPDLGSAVVAPETAEMVSAAAAWLIDLIGLQRKDMDVRVPNLGGAWSVTGGVMLRMAMGDRWPDRGHELTGAMRVGIEATVEHYDVDAAVLAEHKRIGLNEAMADLFEHVDFVFAATNPDVAFEADGRLPTTFGGLEAPPINNGALTIPSNIYGNPAISIPIGLNADGLPVGLQVLAGHHREQLLLDLALAVERERPWPLVAPSGPS